MTTTTEVNDLIETNQFLAEVAAERSAAVWAAIRDRDATGTPIPTEVSDGYDKANAMLHKSATKLAMNSGVGTPVETVNGRLIVASIGTIAESIRKDIPIEVVLTEDGGIANRVWHDGTKDAGAGDLSTVRYEVYSMEGRVAHGYVDPVSRKIVQTG